MLRAVLTAALALLAVAEADVIVYRELPNQGTIEDQFLDLPASFGPPLPVDGLHGLLVVGEPENGCSTMAPPPANFTEKWIVLVARGNCPFVQKVENAMKSGFDCVIVHNVNSSELEHMTTNLTIEINISSVFVNSEAGSRLRQYTYKDGPYHIMVNGDVPFNFNTQILLPFAMIVALCLIIIIIFMIVKCVNDQRRARRHRLPSRSLAQIPTCIFSKGDPYETCAICLDDYQEGERLRVLPCSHAYHTKCIDPWLTQNRHVCPLCKRRVLAAGERSADHSDDSDAPLIDSSDDQPTQSGTFAEQRENPFTLAARLRIMQILMDSHRNRLQDMEGLLNEENTEPTNEQIQEVPAASLALATEMERRRRLRVLAALGLGDDQEANNQSTGGNEVTPGEPVRAEVVREGRPRRARRPRRRAASAGPAPPPPHPAPDTHSINTDTRGEIGVAALPAMSHSSSSPMDRPPTVEYR